MVKEGHTDSDITDLVKEMEIMKVHKHFFICMFIYLFFVVNLSIYLTLHLSRVDGLVFTMAIRAGFTNHLTIYIYLYLQN